MFDTLVNNGTEPELAFKISRELLESGVSEPEMLVVNKGDTLYKVVPAGGPQPSEVSPYFMTNSELMKLPANIAKAGDYLGLPQVPDSFDLYEMSAIKDTIVFQSEVAPFSVNSGEYLRSGGGIQTLVIERNNFSSPKKL